MKAILFGTASTSGGPTEVGPQQYSPSPVDGPESATELQGQRPDQPLALKVRETLGPLQTEARILVVDDEEGVRNLLRHLLSAAGHHVLEATNGVPPWSPDFASLAAST